MFENCTSFKEKFYKLYSVLKLVNISLLAIIFFFFLAICRSLIFEWLIAVCHILKKWRTVAKSRFEKLVKKKKKKKKNSDWKNGWIVEDRRMEEKRKRGKEESNANLTEQQTEKKKINGDVRNCLRNYFYFSRLVLISIEKYEVCSFELLSKHFHWLNWSNFNQFTAIAVAAAADDLR